MQQPFPLPCAKEINVSRAFKFRFSLMMFLEYAVPGSIVPILSLYLKNYLHFEPNQVGRILAMPALAAIVTPFLSAHIADRFISAKRMLALCHLFGGTLMLVLSRQTGFWPFLLLYFGYGLLFTPTFGLTNTVTLHHVADAKRDFGGIRMWGTAGWVVVAWGFGLGWLRIAGADRLRDALVLCVFAAFLLAAYALTLPRARVHTEKPKTLAYWESLKVFARPGLALLCVLTFVNSVVHMFFYYGMGPFLSQIGLPNSLIMPVMSIGQVSEVIVLGLLGAFLGKLGMKAVLALGAFAQVVRHVLFAYAQNTVGILAGIALHGFCYAFWFTAAYLYVDQHSTRKTRAGAQQLFTIIINGIGSYAGYRCAGLVAQHAAAGDTGHLDFTRFWLAPLIMSVAVTLMAVLFFKEAPSAPTDD
jgi:nucleoside transporter